MEIKIRLNAVFLLIVEEADPIRGKKISLIYRLFHSEHMSFYMLLY